MPVGFVELVTITATDLATRAALGSALLQGAITSYGINTLAQGYTAVEALLRGKIDYLIDDNVIISINEALEASEKTTTKTEVLSIVKKVINGTTLTTDETLIYTQLVTIFVTNYVNANTLAVVNGETGTFTLEQLVTNTLGHIMGVEGTSQDLYDATIMTIMSLNFTVLQDYLFGYLSTYFGKNYIEINQAFVGDYSNLTMITEFFDEE